VPRKKRTVPRTIWIAEVLLSEMIIEKIRSKHGLDPDEIARLVKVPAAESGPVCN
jgi:hypothetical protein